MKLPVQVPEHIAKLMLESQERRRAFKIADKAAQVTLWAAVHAEYPELDKDDNFTLDGEYSEQGVVMLKEADSCGNDALKSALRDLASKLKDLN